MLRIPTSARKETAMEIPRTCRVLVVATALLAAVVPALAETSAPEWSSLFSGSASPAPTIQVDSPRFATGSNGELFAYGFVEPVKSSSIVAKLDPTTR
jgi:hypothetical protein